MTDRGRVICREHPDLLAAERTGFASFQRAENRDTPENRQAYIEEHSTQLLRWLYLGYPEILEEFLRFSAQMCPQSYEDWLN